MTERDQNVQINGGDICIHFLEGESRTERSERIMKKLVDRENLELLGNFLRLTNNKVAYASGAYDVIHKGHARFLNLARSLGDILVVGLNSDSSIRAYKGEDRPILKEGDRAEMLSNLESVNYITIYPELTGEEVIRRLKPDVYLCVDGSWQGDIATKAEVLAMVEVGGQIYYSPRQDPIQSTSSIIDIIGETYGRRAVEDYKKMMESGNGK
ncbi:hypothetical protein BH10PAT1_BH10PAT1_0350 [soil metagenome]